MHKFDPVAYYTPCILTAVAALVAAVHPTFAAAFIAAAGWFWSVYATLGANLAVIRTAKPSRSNVALWAVFYGATAIASGAAIAALLWKAVSL
jgi:hypothetical protein